MTPGESHNWYYISRAVRARCIGAGMCAGCSTLGFGHSRDMCSNCYQWKHRGPFGHSVDQCPVLLQLKQDRRVTSRKACVACWRDSQLLWRGLRLLRHGSLLYLCLLCGRWRKRGIALRGHVSRSVTLRSPGRSVLAHRGGYGHFNLSGDVHHREWTACALRAVLFFLATASLAAFSLRARSRLLRGRRLLRPLLLLLRL